MLDKLNITMIVTSLVLFIIIFAFLRKGRIPLKYALVWLLPTCAIFTVAIIPQFLWFVADLIGFTTISNILVGILFITLFFITISLSIIVSGQNTKIILLIQEISTLKSQVEQKSGDK
ncbi:DUF2304 family protein [Clostridiaceae bacterium DONG20-135]|uniref:DUF2304 family protein n=1 Tax=Copranaerobaculum intestinale TaxID=2692629 RepID=A0A6N8U4H6_9FIRM|nr:DUF2304 family protein [Copranaerobaculum intestinale]MXQ72992.1 DUF2304 family protein [Copranaerobaculum intestinale]